jgi:hypothetical protein
LPGPWMGSNDSPSFIIEEKTWIHSLVQKINFYQYIPTAVFRIIGGATLVISVAISLLLFSSVEPNHSEPWLIFSGVCSLGYAAGAMMYRDRNRRVALGFVAGMIG